MENIQNLRESLISFDEQKKKLETEMDQLVAYLTQPGFPGLSGGLVDEEGFPHPHLPITEIRTARHKLACLKTDHQSIKTTIEASLYRLMDLQKQSNGISNLHESHKGNRTAVSEKPIAVTPPPPPPSPTSTPPPAFIEPHIPPNIHPFAVIDEVMHGSPAESAGLESGDKVVKLGELSLKNGQTVSSLFENLPDQVRAHINTSIDITIVRNRQLKHLSIIPSHWSGNGLLGCHILAYHQHS